MRRAVKFVPNLLTLANVALGVTGILLIGMDNMLGAVYCVAVALVFDFLDGFVARLLNAQSELGGQLDSLADAITFGALPCFILAQMLIINQGIYFVDQSQWAVGHWLNVLPALLVAMAAVYRLAMFNLDTTKRPHFMGLPTPAMCLVVLCIPITLEANYHLNFYHPISNYLLDVLNQERRWDASDLLTVRLLGTVWFYQVLSVFLAIVMIAKIPMLSLKFTGISWQLNKWRYALVIWALVCYLIFLIPYLNLPLVEWGRIDFLVAPIFMLGYFALSWIYAIFGAPKSDNT